MFGIFQSLTKAACVVVTAPASLIADAVTMGGALNDRKEPYTATALKDCLKNLQDAAKPD